MPNRSTIIALVEDAHHRMLIYRYLLRRGLSSHDITAKIAPIGQGSAEQWVRANYATEITALRTRHARTSLVVIIDADAHTLDERLSQLARALREARIPQVQAGEPVARLIPKRNVETWILCLHGHQVQEESDYKHEGHQWSELIPEASSRLFQWARPNAQAPSHCVNSLSRGIDELRRLES